MNIADLIKSRRTIRKYQQRKIDSEILVNLVDCARMAPSGRNRQPLEYFIVQDEQLLEPVFRTLSWAGYIAPEGDPKEGEKPTAYIVVLVRSEFADQLAKSDAGAAIENILISAWGYGIGSCWVGSVKRKELAHILSIPDDYTIDSVIALGYPAESPVAEDNHQSTKYYKDDKGVLHVPKRPLKSILHMDKWDKGV